MFASCEKQKTRQTPEHHYVHLLGPSLRPASLRARCRQPASFRRSLYQISLTYPFRILYPLPPIFLVSPLHKLPPPSSLHTLYSKSLNRLSRSILGGTASTPQFLLHTAGNTVGRDCSYLYPHDGQPSWLWLLPNATGTYQGRCGCCAQNPQKTLLPRMQL